MNVRLLAVSLVGVAALVACTEPPDPKSFCGTGTRLEEGKCVPIPEATCPTGEARISGSCRPICGTNTSDTATGCVVAEGACSAGTRLKDGACVVIDPMERVQVREAAEPNFEPAKGKTFELPAAGATPVVLGGAVGAVTAGAGDFDAFIFNASAGTRVRIAAVAVGAPAVAARVYPLAAAGSEHADKLASYVFSSSSREAVRELNLPLSGDWVIEVSTPDNYPLFGAVPTGSDAFTYTVDVSQVAPASASPLTSGTPATGTFASGGVYSLAADTTRALYELNLAAGSVPFQGLRRITVVDKAGKLLGVAADTVTPGGIKPLAKTRFAVPAAGASVYVDHSLALDAAGDYSLTATKGEVEELAVPTAAATNGSLAGDGYQVFSFEVTALARLAAKVTKGTGVAALKCELRNPAFGVAAEVTSTSSSGSVIETLVQESGQWFLVCEDPAFTPDNQAALPYTVSVDVEEVTNLGSLGAGAGLETQQALTLNEPPAATYTGFSKYFRAFAMFTLTTESAVTVITRPDATTPTVKTDINLLTTAFASIRTATATTTRATASGYPNGNKSDAVILPPGTYLVQGSNYSSNATGNVLISVESAAITSVAEVEPNDTVGTASPVAVGATEVVVKGAHPTVSDKLDHYKLQVADAGKLNVRIQRDPLSANSFKVTLRKAGGATDLASTTVSTFSSFSSYEATLSSVVEPGDYVLAFEFDYTSTASKTGGYYFGVASKPTPPGEACSDSMTAISATTSLPTETLVDYTSDFTSSANGSSCKVFSGRDRTYRISIPAGATLTATLVPDSTWDPSLGFIIGAAAVCSGTMTCAAAVDVGYDGEEEVLTYTNSGTSAVDGFLIVDSYTPLSSSTYTYSLDIQIQ
jgi:hypothetical protein